MKKKTTLRERIETEGMEYPRRFYELACEAHPDLPIDPDDATDDEIRCALMSYVDSMVNDG